MIHVGARRRRRCAAAVQYQQRGNEALAIYALAAIERAAGLEQSALHHFDEASSVASACAMTLLQLRADAQRQQLRHAVRQGSEPTGSGDKAGPAP